MGLNINEIKQARCHYITMGADENRLLYKEIRRKKKECGPLPIEERRNIYFGSTGSASTGSAKPRSQG